MGSTERHPLAHIVKDSNIVNFNTGKVIDMVSALPSGYLRGARGKEIHQNR